MAGASLLASSHSQGLEALTLSIAIAAIAVGILFVLAYFLAPRHPHFAALFEGLNVLVVLSQVLDGATTWVGVENPFDLRIPRFQETVFVSGLIIKAFGGFVYFLLKTLLGVGVVLALSYARHTAPSTKERLLVLLVQLSLIVIGTIPVVNNTLNFLAVA